MIGLFKEGSAEFQAAKGEISSKLEVFYNPMMELNRSVSVWLVKKLKPKAICCPMVASGVRPIRLALEAGAKNITANDASRTAFDFMVRNFARNNVKIEAFNLPMRQLLEGRRFDYIDIDPFGTPSYYIRPALGSLNEDGILALTATDTSCLCGRYIKACERKYSARPLRCGFSKEIGLRILIGKAQEVAGDRLLTPVMSHSSNHYMRAYLRYGGKGRNERGFVLYCPKCLSWRVSGGEEGSCCGSEMEHAGPLYTGPLWDRDFVKDFGLIPYIKEESEVGVLGFYDTHDIAQVYQKDAPRIERLIECLKKKGFKASRTHFKPEGVKTDAEIKEVTSCP